MIMVVNAQEMICEGKSFFWIHYILLAQWFSNCVPRHFGMPSEI